MIFSAVLSDEDYLITRMCNCQCFLYFSYFSCNSYNFFFKSLKSTTDTTNFFDFKSAYGTGFLLPEIPDQDFSFYYISTSNSNCDKISFCISIPGYTSISFNPFGVSRNTHLSVTYSTSVHLKLHVLRRNLHFLLYLQTLEQNLPFQLLQHLFSA